MGKGKKSKGFDKKNAAHFVLAPRSQADPLREEGGNVLLPSESAIPIAHRSFVRTSTLDPDVRRKNVEMGFPDDGYDYTQHLAKLGGGTYVQADGKVVRDGSHVKAELPEGLLPMEDPSSKPSTDLLEAHDTIADAMPADVSRLLDDDGYSTAAESEMEDDFVQALANPEYVEPGVEESKGGEAVEFDWDAHLAKLLHETADDSEDGEEFLTDDEEGGKGGIPDLARKYMEAPERPETFEDSHLAVIMRQYDDEQLGELDEDDPRLEVSMAIKPKRLDALMDEFLTQQAKTNPKADEDSVIREKVLELVKKQEAGIKMEGGKEVIDVPERVPAALRSKWDCETIISTYSNVSHHPTVLEGPMDSGVKPIKLSAKTGLPIGLSLKGGATEEDDDGKEHELGTVEEDEDEIVDVPVMSAPTDRPKHKKESAEEKKARKMAVKEERKARRMAKKELRTVYKTEKARQQRSTSRKGESVFTY